MSWTRRKQEKNFSINEIFSDLILHSQMLWTFIVRGKIIFELFLNGMGGDKREKKYNSINNILGHLILSDGMDIHFEGKRRIISELLFVMPWTQTKEERNQFPSILS